MKILREEGLLEEAEDETGDGKKEGDDEGDNLLDLLEEEKVVKPEDEMEDVEFKQYVLEMKENKFIKQRNPAQYHRELPRYDRMKLALMMHFGMKPKKTGNVEISEGT